MVRQIADKEKKRHLVNAMATAILVVTMSLLCLDTNVYATEPFGDFDPLYYAERYPDVVKELTDDPYCLYSHYLDIGIDEGRYPNKEAEIKETSGDTYIDIDLENQHVVYYENGVAVIETDCVSGDVDDGRSTPKGTYKIETMTNGKYLIGPTWKSWVDYWMRFNGSIGLHDASWRSKFGGEIYKTSGSHGCVNIPSDKAAAIFKRVTVGTTVIVR